MGSNVGRTVAVLLAIVLAVVAPLSIKAEIRSSTINSLAQAAVDELTSQAGIEGAVTLAAYEKLLAELSDIGLICEPQLQIGRHELRYSDGRSPISEDECLSLRFCAAHVHTSACYRGHNHTAEGCTYHTHTSACYCEGRMTREYRSEQSFHTCASCGGKGTTGESRTCSECGGTGKWSKQLKCNNCTNGIMTKNEICSKCNGSGVSSKGSVCTRCDGYGMRGVKSTCNVCGGLGYRIGTFNCSTCGGSGKVSNLATCSSCNGRGGWYSYESYYECSVCGGGSTTSYGSSCGRRICGYLNSGYSCGITMNDTTPLCDRIIVDVAYNSEQTVCVNDSSLALDTRMSVKYLNGSSETVAAAVDGTQIFDRSGETMAQLILNGYFENAGNYGQKSFPVHVTVVNGGRICEICGRTYYPDPDGIDRGCPYCYLGVIGIRVECQKLEYHIGEAFEGQVYALFADGTEMEVPWEDTWNTFNSQYPGESTVFVGYLQFMQEINVLVLDSQEQQPTPLPAEDPGDNKDENSSNPDEESEGNPVNIPDENSENENENRTGVLSEVVIDSGYREFLTTEEIVELLVNNGRIELDSGDAFSVKIVVENVKGATAFSGKRNRIFTSGIIID